MNANKLADPDDAHELTDAYFERADVYDGNTLVRAGRDPKRLPLVSTRKHRGVM